MVKTILFIWAGTFIPVKYLENIERAMEVYPEAKLKIIISGDRENPRLYSDKERVKYLSENPYTLYLDCDAWCVKPIPADQKGSAGIWAIYNHNDLETFKDILNRMPVYFGKMIQGNRLDEYFKHTKGGK